MKDYILTPEEINYLKRYSKEFTFNTQTEIIYAGQTPKVIYILIEGSIDFYNKKNKFVKKCPMYTMIGIDEFHYNTAYKRTAVINAGSKVLILDRTAVNELKIENFSLFKEYQKAS